MAVCKRVAVHVRMWGHVLACPRCPAREKICVVKVEVSLWVKKVISFLHAYQIVALSVWLLLSVVLMKI
jgi:hypothetical protein